MTDLIELGRATTQGQVLPLGVDDPVVAARAVRRALAAAQHRAIDVTDFVLASTEPVAPDVLAAFARRALGPRGTDVRTTCLVDATTDATGLAAQASATAAAIASSDIGLVIAIGVARDGTTEARCLGRG